MKQASNLIFTVFIFILAASFAISNFNWNLDKDYAIHFSGSKMEGTFSGLAGKIVFNPSNLAGAVIDMEVDAATVKTGNSMKDDHAKNDSWLDVAKYPKIFFKSSSFSKTTDGYLVKGILTLHGTSKEITIPFAFSETNGKGIFTGKFKIDRKDYGVKGNFMASAMGGELDIELKVPVTKQ